MAPYSRHHVAVGRAIRCFREAAGVSQEALAARIGLDRSFMGGIERGERNFSFAKLLLVCEGLDITPSELMAEYERELRRA